MSDYILSMTKFAVGIFLCSFLMRIFSDNSIVNIFSTFCPIMIFLIMLDALVDFRFSIFISRILGIKHSLDKD